MMSRLITGPLYAPNGERLANTDITFASLEVGERVLKRIAGVTRTDSEGVINATLEDGRYSVSVTYREGQGALSGRPLWIGNITITSGPPVPLLDLLD